MAERELNVQKAKFAEQAERYEDMREAMKLVVEADGPLSSEERNLMSVAYKNVCGARRSAWRITNSLMANAQQTSSNESASKAGEEMKKKIEGELNDICQEVHKLIKDHLTKDDADAEHKTFFFKMEGDYYRYRVEVANPDSPDRASLIQDAKEAYKSAMKEADKLPSTHPIRLGLALNFSVFFFEIENDHVAACDMAKSAFDGAIADLDSLKEDSYKDSTLIMQLLRDNLTLWSTESTENDDDDDE